MTGSPPDPIRVLCVDDDRDLADAVRARIVRYTRDLAWAGWLPNADNLPEQAAELRADVVLLDIDMPGADALDALAEVAARVPSSRCVILSGYVTKELIARAIDAGAWAYVAKEDSPAELFDAVRRVAVGEFVLSPAATAEFRFDV